MAKTDPNVDIQEMDDDTLMEEWTALANQMLVDRERSVAFNEEHKRRTRKAMLARAMDLTEEDLALVQEIVAEGVPSEEAVGTPGGE